MNISHAFQKINLEVHEDLQNIPYSQWCQVRAALGTICINQNFWLSHAVDLKAVQSSGLYSGYQNTCVEWEEIWVFFGVFRYLFQYVFCQMISVLSLHVSFCCAANTNKICSFNLLTITVKQYIPLWALPEWQV